MHLQGKGNSSLEGLRMADTRSELYLKTKQVRERYGNVSDMWIIRRMRDADFPLTIYFGRLRFWRESDLVAWENAQITAPKARPSRDMTVAREGKVVRHG
jgi:predicted DNA-binding transcriptional regulator AlpA